VTAVREAPNPDAPAPARGWRAGRIWAGRRHGRVRPLWWFELLIIVVGDRVYEYIRNLVPTNKGTAEDHARFIERFEGDLHINFGLTLNHFVARQEWLAQIMNYYYATLWLAATVAMLVWLYIARPSHYRRLRTILAITTFLGLAGFYLYPLAPPRLMPQFGYIDTIIKFHTWGSWADPTVATHSNQYAAMPSLHTAWALWCAFSLFTVARRPWVKALAWCYPAATVLVIVGTANHYLLDAVGGALIFSIAYGLERAMAGWRRARVSRRRTAAPPPGEPGESPAGSRRPADRDRSPADTPAPARRQ
jgi:hypothetical protein